MNYVVAIVLVLLVVLFVISFGGFGGASEGVVAHKSFRSALEDKYRDEKKDAGGMTANDYALETAFMSGQTS